MNKIIKFIFLDIFKNRIVLLYTILLSAFAWSAFSLEDNGSKGVLTLLNIILLTVPLFSVLFATIYIYNSAEFIELLLSQPIRRQTIWSSLFLSLSFTFILSFLISAGIPILIYTPFDIGFMLITIGCIISVVFISIAFLSAILTRDKSKGIGLSIILWLYFAVLFDGLILFLTFQFSDYPIEKPLIFLSALSPIDISRILILLHIDSSAMMGYTGAIFKDFFGTTIGLIASFAILLSWIFFPFVLSLKLFKSKDL